MTENNDKLDNIRHSLAHLLAAAVLKRWPEAKLGIGPTIDNGFYYDIHFPGEENIKEEDLKNLENDMKDMIENDLPFSGSEITKKEAKEKFKNQPFKLELIEEFSQEGKDLKVYETGSIFTDLCRGGHVESTGEINPNAFKLDKIAGAYWRGDEENEMLTRIYGLAFDTEEELDKYLKRREEAKKRDHRKLGKKLNLFLISQDVGSGLPIFTPKGNILREGIEDFLTEEKKRRGYEFIWTPHIAKSDLYHKSGHWGKYDAMFNPMDLDKDEYVVKPMNCPHHFQVYLNQPRSYRDLPLRLSQNGTVYRNEKSGELSGLLRVRSLTIDDTHTFLRDDQLAPELNNVLNLIKTVWDTFGFENYRARISTRDPNTPDKYQGSSEKWDKAENALKKAVKEVGLDFEVGEGEAAFYGPKIDILVKDAIGRDWQLSTVQLDYNQPENFDMTYTSEKGEDERPVIIHTAIVGSIERFMGVLIEHLEGNFPTWLSPVQVSILPISEDQMDYANKVKESLEERNLRVEIPDVDESLGKRIRNFEKARNPYALIVGGDEKEAGTVSVRKREGGDVGEKDLNDFVESITEEVENKE